MRFPTRWRLFSVAVASFILIALWHPSGNATEVFPAVGTGCRALQAIRAEGGIVLPKGTEFRFHADPLGGGGGTITLTLIVDSPETLKAQFTAIENPSLMYHVAK